MSQTKITETESHDADAIEAIQDETLVTATGGHGFAIGFAPVAYAAAPAYYAAPAPAYYAAPAPVAYAAPAAVAYARPVAYARWWR